MAEVPLSKASDHTVAPQELHLQLLCMFTAYSVYAHMNVCLQLLDGLNGKVKFLCV